MPVSTTTIPLTDALGRALRDLFITYAAPAINADLTAMMHTAQGVSTANVPQFSAVNVRIGDIDPVSETTLCICPAVTENLIYEPTGSYLFEFASLFTLKIPATGDNAPEDFMLVGNSVRDHCRDLFTNRRVITPLNSAGHNILPTGLSFNECRYKRCIGPIIVTGINNAERYRKWEISHYCTIGYSDGRAQPLGG